MLLLSLAAAIAAMGLLMAVVLSTPPTIPR
jgi:hypothetical protein